MCHEMEASASCFVMSKLFSKSSAVLSVLYIVLFFLLAGLIRF
jgi:hypothetical protein